MIKVLLVDDHRLVRAGYRSILASEPDIVVSGEAGNGAEAQVCLRGQPVDVVVLDVSMPGESGIQVLPKLKQIAPNTHVLMVSMHMEPRISFRAIEAGASGYLTKESAPEELVAAIRRVCAGTPLS